MRDEFSKKTKLAAWDRCKGKCEECELKIISLPEYDHILEAYLGGDSTLENCRVLCRKCHARKTKSRRPALDKTRRLLEKRVNARPKGRGFRGWRSMSGEIRWAK